MEGDSNQLHPMVDVEEYENEDSIGISNVGTDSSPENEVAQDMVSNEFAKSLELQWAKLSRDAAKNDCFATFEIEKRKLRNLLRGFLKVNIITDMWTSCQRLYYMVVTCHFIDYDWRLNRRVLNFCNVPPPDTGFLIADALQKSFQEWEIENKISSITVDNAKANDTSIRVLKDVFNRRKALLIGGKLFHVRCCAHITNLLVQDGLDEISLIVDCVRDGIKCLVASESRLIKFSEIAIGL
ncbi:zinc finger BED domain-containing protein RICESLEEPER 2-like [Corylus avellana]|uniref:zinc finger BED domain-containing protein RICESLEEPER 2-like n=1 Tax=Corylus avellana TaxID=13451 RepID=UPI00286CA55A|nr:zinc finger BED domain-containing protein RICESLEEPER 2-like [Corylus avellana]